MRPAESSVAENLYWSRSTAYAGRITTDGIGMVIPRHGKSQPDRPAKPKGAASQRPPAAFAIRTIDASGVTAPRIAPNGLPFVPCRAACAPYRRMDAAIAIT